MSGRRPGCILHAHCHIYCPGVHGTLSTSGSRQRCVFSREGRIFGHEVFFRMYLPLALQVYTRLFIDSLGFIVVRDTYWGSFSQIDTLALIAVIWFAPIGVPYHNLTMSERLV